MSIKVRSGGSYPYVSSHLLQVFLPLILAISLLACAITAAKTAIIGEIAQPETLWADSTTQSGMFRQLAPVQPP